MTPEQSLSTRTQSTFVEEASTPRQHLGTKSDCLRIAVDEVTTSSDLYDQALKNLQDTFQVRDQRPSKAMWTALKSVLRTMEDMANGTCSDAVHVCSLDPGVGKTTAVVCFIKALLRSPERDAVGVLVCVQRRAQIKAIVEEVGLEQDEFAVLTADDALNALGSASLGNARILFTTHSMVEKRCEGSSFAEVPTFHFRGLPRAVRIWDEAILPGLPLTVSRDKLGLLFSPFRAAHPDLAAKIENLFTHLGSTKDGTIEPLPDLAEAHGVDLNAALGVVEGGSEDQKAAVEALWFLFGKTVTVRRDGAYGNTLLDYRDTLPKDLTPLLVLDASARVRSTYPLWAKGRGGLIQLPEAPKRYEKHVCHVWPRSGGKSGFRRHGQLLVEGIASTIRSKLKEDWLVVHHKAAAGVDVERAVRELLPSNARVSFLHWGTHDATNEFQHVPNVILAGTLFYRLSHYEALTRMVAGRPSSSGPVSASDIREVIAGEHRHLILQALCRGAVRRCVGGGCPPTHTYIIAGPRSGIAADLPRILPGVTIKRWQPVATALSGKVADAVQYLVARFANDPSAHVAFREVMQQLGWSDGSNFRQRIRQHDDFIAAMDAEGVVEWGAGKWATGFRKVASVWGIVGDQESSVSGLPTTSSEAR